MQLKLAVYDYVRILLYLSRKGGKLVKVPLVAESLGIPLQMAQQQTTRLKRAGYIRSVRGPCGGVTLARRPNDIRIGEVVRDAERDAAGERADDDAAGHDTRTAALMDQAFGKLVAHLNQHRLSDLAGASDPSLDGPHDRSSRDTGSVGRESGPRKGRRSTWRESGGARQGR